MALFGFERDTLLDLTVNMIPLLILAFFFVAFLVVPTWGVDPVFTAMQLGIVGASFVVLVVLTYYAGKAVQAAEAGEDANGE